ncbi:hypothetical protein [Paraburkholderia xenovorans]|uniref:hypothetical protein n=1 Tax=Paraburkholderia xenovorans TaxID=36873 RepID=UPI0038BD2DAD
MKIMLALTAVTVLAGCATQPVSDSEAKQITAPAFVRIDVADTAIIITRDSGLANGGSTAHILIDGHFAVSCDRHSRRAFI